MRVLLENLIKILNIAFHYVDFNCDFRAEDQIKK